MEVTEGRFFFFNFYLFTSFWIFLAVLGLHCCARAFSSCGKWGLLFVVVLGLLVVVASLMGALGCLGFGSCPLQRGVQWLWCTGLVARWHPGYSWIRDWTHRSSGEDSACQCRRCKRHGFNPWVGKTPWRRVWQPTPVFFPGESHGQMSLAGYSP